MTRDVEAVAAKKGLTATEFITNLVAEAIEDARDYERCMKLVDDYEKDHVSYSHDEIMKEFGLR